MALGSLARQASALTRTGCAAPRRLAARRRSLVVPRASEFDLSQYQEASIAEVREAEKNQHVILLRVKDTQAVIPMYIGEFECGSLTKEMNKTPMPRPLTHDFMKATLEALGYRVTRVRIHQLIGTTYHARVHYARSRRAGGPGLAAGAPPPQEIDVDARPSDAVNLAVRFGAPIYVSRDVAAKMGQPARSYDARSSRNSGGEPDTAVVESCRAEILAYNDPTIMLKLQMQIAIADERFEDAKQMRDQIDKILASNRALSLVVAMETAIEDGRFDEAARLRDEFKALRRAQQLSSREVSDI